MALPVWQLALLTATLAIVAVLFSAKGAASQSLVIAGNFQTAAGVPANGIAQQLTPTGPVSPMSAGINNGKQVNVVLQYQAVLVTGGLFITAGDAVVNNIAQWDGAKWSALGAGRPGTSDAVTALCDYNGLLIVGGLFDVAGNVAANRIASWNGYTWGTLGTGLSAASGVGVLALAVFQNALFVFGTFGSAGGISASNVAQYNGTSWCTAAGLPWPVQFIDSARVAAVTYNSYLVVAVYSGSSYSPNLNFWNGATWTDMGGLGTSGASASALVVYNGNLVAAAYYDGGLYFWTQSAEVWTQMALGPGHTIWCMVYYGGALITGGSSGSYWKYGRVTLWNGQWSALSLVSQPFGTAVFSLAIYSHLPPGGAPSPSAGVPPATQPPSSGPVAPTMPMLSPAPSTAAAMPTFYIVSVLLGGAAALIVVCTIGLCFFLFGKRAIVRWLGSDAKCRNQPASWSEAADLRGHLEQPGDLDDEAAISTELHEVSLSIGPAPSAPPYPVHGTEHQAPVPNCLFVSP